MSRHIDFRDDRDMAFSGIVDDIANLVLCIEAPSSFPSYVPELWPITVSLRLDPICVNSGYFLISIRQPWSSDRCQWNVFWLLQGKDIEIRFYRIHGEEMAADIQPHASIGKTGIVVDGSCR